MADSVQIAVLGAGSWGTALGVLLARNGHAVRVWDIDRTVVDEIRASRTNIRYAPGVQLPEGFMSCASAPETADGAGMLWIAVPAAGVAHACAEVREHLASDITVVSATKGLCPATGRRMSQVVSEALVANPERVVVLSGPNLATEVCAGVPTATVASGASRSRMEQVRTTASCRAFRVYTNPDTIGVELGGAFKNVVAIGAGINDGLGYADNSKATLITRGLAEMTRLGVALGARSETFGGLSGVGDLVVTSVSVKSRNYRVGYGLAVGRPLDEILAELGQVAEGVPTAKAVRRLAEELGVDAPITRAICGVLFEGVAPRDAVVELMTRAPRDEIEELPLAPDRSPE